MGARVFWQLELSQEASEEEITHSTFLTFRPVTN